MITAREVWLAIPRDDKATFRRIADGRTGGMFQLEGKAQTYGLSELRPKRLDDIVAGQALFRPATLQNGDAKEFIARRSKKKPVPQRHPDIAAETADTYGLCIYQEQVIGLLRRIGMPSDELTDALDAVKASNEASAAAKAHLEQIRGRVGELAQARGWSEQDVAWLVSALAGYGEYSFNKAHAVAYGVVAYKSAWLVEHHPVEFWTGMLAAFQGKKRGRKDLEGHYVAFARANKVRVSPPHVNRSSVGYTLDRAGMVIRKGLTSVRGVGLKTARHLVQNAPYTSLTDMGQRLPTSVGGALHLALRKEPHTCGGVIAALYDALALDGLEHDPKET